MDRERSARRRRVSLTLLLVGLMCAGAAVYAERRAERPRREAAGQVVRTRAYKVNEHWHREVEFRYDHSGVTYVGRESRLLRKSFRNEAEVLSSSAELSPLSPGDSVVVYYDESAPGVATLDAGKRSFRFFAAAGLLWFLLACLWFVYDRSQNSDADR